MKELQKAPKPKMALKTKKGLKGSIDDVLGDLLGDDTLLEKPFEPASHAKDTASTPQWPPSKAKARSLQKDSVEGLMGADAEVSSVSDADPQVFLQNMKEMPFPLRGHLPLPAALGFSTGSFPLKTHWQDFSLIRRKKLPRSHPQWRVSLLRRAPAWLQAKVLLFL